MYFYVRNKGIEKERKREKKKLHDKNNSQVSEN